MLLDAESEAHLPSFPGWDVLRMLAGEIVEVSAFADREEVRHDEAVLLAGRFERGGLFQVNLLPNRSQSLLRIRVTLQYQQAELVFPDGWPGVAQLTWTDDSGQPREEHWPDWNPWPRVVELFEQALARRDPTPEADKHPEPVLLPLGGLSWEDEVRAVELDDAARRSIERRRSSTLEYQEDVEEASFKGTMTLFGCGLLWASLLLLILSVWVPWLGWIIFPLFAAFLLLQLLRWVIPPQQGQKPQ